MTAWLLWRTLLEAIGVAFPVAILAATLMFVDQAVHAMTTRPSGPCSPRCGSWPGRSTWTSPPSAGA